MTRAADQPVRPERWLRLAFVFAVLAFVWWRVADNTVDNDLWGHVLYGERMLTRGALERTEVLSWTAAGAPWINHEVGAEAVMAWAHLSGGSMGLWLLMIGLAAVTLGWAWRTGAGPKREHWIAALALLAISTNSIALGYAMRPQLFTYLFFVALLVGLRRFGDGQKTQLLALPLLLALWVNFHGGYLAGWIVLVAAVGSELVAGLMPAAAARLRCAPSPVRPSFLLALAALATAALLANPWGWSLVEWTIATVRLPRPAIGEWHPLLPGVATLPFYSAIALGLAAWLVSRAPRRAWEIVVWLLCAAAAIRHQRNAPLFGLASVLLLPPHLTDLARILVGTTDSLRAALKRPVVALTLATALIAGGVACLNASILPHGLDALRMRVPRDLYPVQAIQFIRTEGLSGRTLTFFDWGQQVLWELPANPVSFDGRLDTVYSPALMNAHWDLYAGRDPGPALDVDRADLALLPTGSPGVEWLRARGWSLAYVDLLASVLTRQQTGHPTRLGLSSGLEGSVSFPDMPSALARGEPR